MDENGLDEISAQEMEELLATPEPRSTQGRLLGLVGDTWTAGALFVLGFVAFGTLALAAVALSDDWDALGALLIVFGVAELAVAVAGMYAWGRGVLTLRFPQDWNALPPLFQ